MIGFSAQDWLGKASAAMQAGDLVGALATLHSGIKSFPNDASLWHGAGSVLMAQDNPNEAAELFGKAFALEPKQFDHAIDQAVALSAANHNSAAIEALVKVERKGAKYAHYCSTRANAERGVGNLRDAAKWYDRALRIEPERHKALVGRANVALERAEPKALGWFDRAIRVDPGNPFLWLGKAQALDADGDTPGAIMVMQQVADQAPGFIEGLRYLAQLQHTRGDPDFAAHFEDAVRQMPQNPNIRDSWCKTLAALEFNAEAAEIAARARKIAVNEPHFALLEAVYSGAAGDNDKAEAIFAKLDLDHLDRITHEARHRIRRGEFDAAAKLLEAAVKKAPDDISIWSLRDIVWRLTGDKRAEWLHGQKGLIQICELAGRDRLLDDAIHELRRLHDGAPMPLGQSVRGGTQTRGNLFQRSEKVFAELRKAVLVSLKEYRAALPPADPDHPLLRHRDAEWGLAGSWSVRLTGDGAHHAPHIHPDGIISSAMYLIAPDNAQDTDCQNGWLELGRPARDLALDLPPITAIQPKRGQLVLFPSSLYHGTTAFGGPDNAERMTVVFDVVLK